MLALGVETPVRRCRQCARWAYDGEILCPECDTPLADMRPFSHRPAYVIAFVFVLTAVVTALWFVVRA